MHYTGRKGWQASYKDTWNVDATLDPIIHAVLVKFREQSHKDEFGSPLEGDNIHSRWKAILDKMIYAFDKNNEPKIEDYKFKFETVALPDGFHTINVINQEEYARYNKDEAEWERKCEEGRMLFAKHYKDLWW